MAVPNFLNHFATVGGAGNSYMRGSSMAESQDQERKRTRAAQKQASAAMMNARTALKKIKSQEKLQKESQDFTKEQNKLARDQKSEQFDRSIEFDQGKMDLERKKHAETMLQRDREASLTNATNNMRNQLTGLGHMVDLLGVRSREKIAEDNRKAAEAKLILQHESKRANMLSLRKSDAMLADEYLTRTLQKKTFWNNEVGDDVKGYVMDNLSRAFKEEYEESVANKERVMGKEDLIIRAVDRILEETPKEGKGSLDKPFEIFGGGDWNLN